MKGNNIGIIIPANNAGKFRFKKRKSRFDFGKTFPTRNEKFDEQVYLEWQIGYYVPATKVKEGEKKTELDKTYFKANNGQNKYPYELSEMFYLAIKHKLIAKQTVTKLLNEIKNYSIFIDQKAITVERHSKITINGVNFEETSIKLPTLFMVETLDGTQIEVSIQKQQYATGIQPMIYFCIPFKSFDNYSILIGKSSVPSDNLTYLITKSNVQNLVNLMRVFGMASKRHKHDIIQIIETLIKLI